MKFLLTCQGVGIIEGRFVCIQLSVYDLGSHCRILLLQVVERSNRPEAIEATCNMFSHPSLIRFNEFF